MVCGNCGFENPSVHRYCGMCGTPIPHRDLTVPQAQSTLAYTCVPTEVAAASLPIPVAQPKAQEVEEIAVVEPVAGEAAEVAEAAVAEAAPVVVEPAVEERAVVAEVEPEVVPAAVEAPLEATFEELAAAPVIEHAASSEAPIAREEAEAPAEAGVAEEVVAEVVAEPVEVTPDPVAVKEETVVQPKTEPEFHPEPVAEEQEPEVPREAAAAATPNVETPALRVLVMPPPRRTPPPVAEPARPRPVHPSPDSIPIMEPPASAGMPTFHDVNEAAGAPAISPFEPPVAKHTDEERELQEYVASFRYTPPAETADELTMRSEVPDIDEAEPEEFHHPSFDGDEAPPPEAGSHPTGEEYYLPSGAARDSRVLDLSHEPHGHHEGGRSTLGLEELGTTPMPIDGTIGKPVRNHRRWWWWVAALIVVCGGLGFWEGRAQSAHEFRGPVELAREAYGELRRRVAEMKSASNTAAAPAGAESAQTAANPVEKAAPETKPADTAPAKPEETANVQDSAAKEPPAQAAPSASDQPAAKDTSNTPAAETAKVVPPKAIEAPVTKPSGKPQPGQQELNKAMEASDSAAAAAWLWKATSRGNPEAPVRLADMYIRGNGVPKSCEQALVLLRSAATKENAGARNRLAALYANGTCVARDRVKAYELMTSALAADPSSEWAKENRTTLLNQMTPQERAEAVKPH